MINNTKVTAVIVAGGTSSRMGFDKLFYPVGNREMLRVSIDKFDAQEYIDDIVVVVSGKNLQRVTLLLKAYPPQKPFKIVLGGKTRIQSAAYGVQASDSQLVAIHDAARPFVSNDIIKKTIQKAYKHKAAICAVSVKDTIKQISPEGVIIQTIPRESIYSVQTPQVFDRQLYLECFAKIGTNEYESMTDDCMVIEKYSDTTVYMVEGSYQNKKITTIDDLPVEPTTMGIIRVGHGYDVHRLVENKKLILGGVTIPFEKGLQGHSDADVVLHAICDALLGASALGDIGKHFPDTDPKYKDIDSRYLLKETILLVRKHGWNVSNIDVSIVCEKPKLSPFIDEMCQNIASILHIKKSDVSIKATTQEGMGFVGVGDGIAAHCVTLICSI